MKNVLDGCPRGLNQIKAFLSCNKKFRDRLSRVDVVALCSAGTQVLKAFCPNILSVASWFQDGCWNASHHIHERGRNQRECLPDESVPFMKLSHKFYQKTSTCLSLAGKCSFLASIKMLDALGKVEGERSCVIGIQHLCHLSYSRCCRQSSLSEDKYGNTNLQTFIAT